MADALVTSLSSALPPSTVEEVARNLSESPQAVSRGLEFSAAAVLTRLIHHTGDGAMMRRVIDAASQMPANALSSSVNQGIQTPQNAPLLSNSQSLTTSLFGEDKQQRVIQWISRETGLRTAAASTVLGLSTLSVLDRLGARVRQQGMTASSLATYLLGERASLSNALPPGLHEILPTTTSVNPVIAQAIETNPVVGQGIKKEGSFLPWLLALLAGLILLGWYFLRSHEPVTTIEAPAPVVTQPVPAATDLGSMVQRQLPGGLALNVPENGVEGRLLVFIQDPNSVPDKTTWFDFDRLLFDTGLATLQPQSEEQLRNIAAILRAYPNVHLKIGGYTDNVGDAAANMKLSQDRATNVMNELVRMGISPDRLEAQGYGEDHPVGDSSTEAGRAQNRRISMLVTQK